MSDSNYRPKGDLSGDPKMIPDKGSKTAVTDGYGANLDPTATNREGPISGSTMSDGMQEGGLSKNKRKGG